MKVNPLYQIELNALRAVFPFYEKPPLSISDYLGEYASAGFPRYGSDGHIYSGNDDVATNGAQGQIEFDPIAKVVHARAIFMLHDQQLGDTSGNYGYGYGNDCFDENGLPILNWGHFAFSSGVSGNFDIVPRAPGFNALRYSFFPNPASFIGVGEACVACQGFTGFVKLAAPKDLRGKQAWASISWRVAGSANGVHRWFAVSWNVGDGAWFGYNDANDADGLPVDGYWTDIDKIQTGSLAEDLMVSSWDPLNTFTTDGGDPNDPNMNPPSHTVIVKYIGGLMQVYVDSEQTPFVFPHTVTDSNGQPDWLIDKWQIGGDNLNLCEWSVHPTKFAVDSATVSVDQNLGFVPSGAQLANIVQRVHYLPNYGAAGTQTNTHVGFTPPGCGASVSTYSLFGTIYRYLLHIHNQQAYLSNTWKGFTFADFTAAVEAVTIDFDGDIYSISEAPTILGTSGNPPNPARLEIQHTFDLNHLSITSAIDMVFNNYKGVWTNSMGTGVVDENGHIAAAVDLGIEYYGTTRREWTGVFNTEYSNNWGGGGNDDVKISGEDCSIMLRVPAWAIPWMDGWNVYYVIAFLAALGGITISQLAFASLVPASPYDPSPGIPADQNYYLPLGPAGTALTRFTGGQILWDIMLKISQSIGFMLFFDVNGLLKFFKFGTNSSSPVKVFNYVAGKYGGGTGLDEIFSGTYQGGLKETRNHVIVIGVNALGPLWNPIVAHSQDDDSIFNNHVANYKGYFDPVVWVDNLFANLPFAQAASDALLAFLRLPDRSVTFSTWYPGDVGVYPGDLIGVNYPRSAASLFTFFVTSTRTTVSKGQIPRMDITARIVPHFS